jgi:hypothetical protein
MNKNGEIWPLMLLFGLPLMVLEILLTTIVHLASKLK